MYGSPRAKDIAGRPAIGDDAPGPLKPAALTITDLTLRQQSNDSSAELGKRLEGGSATGSLTSLAHCDHRVRIDLALPGTLLQLPSCEAPVGNIAGPGGASDEVKGKAAALDAAQLQRFWSTWALQRRQTQETMLRSLDRSLDAQEQLLLQMLRRPPEADAPALASDRIEGHAWKSEEQESSCCRPSIHSGSLVAKNGVCSRSGSKPTKGVAWEEIDANTRSSTKNDSAWSSITPSQTRTVSDKAPTRHYRRTNTAVSAVSDKTKEKKSKLLRAYLGETTTSLTQQVLPAWVLRWWTWWMDLKEPKRSGCICSIIKSKAFDASVMVVILINSVYTGYQANHEITMLASQQHYSQPESDAWLEPLFLVVFSMEMLAKMYVHRQYTFCNDDMLWNAFDFTLLMVAAVNTIMICMMDWESENNVTFARALRFFKLGKILRIFRAVRFLHELRLMVASILGSFRSLFWSFIMLGMILFVFALLFVQQMAVYVADMSAAGSTELQPMQLKYFGSVQQTVLTLAMTTTGGVDWEDTFELVRPLGSPYAFAFVFYIVFFTFAVMNILTGIFVENAMAICKPDEEEAILIRQQKEVKEREELKCILEFINRSGTGKITSAEFVSAADNDAIAHALASLGMDIKDSNLFFSTLAEDGLIDIDEFVDHAMNLRGPATSIDLHGLINQTLLMRQAVAEFNAQVGDLRSHMVTPPVQPQQFILNEEPKLLHLDRGLHAAGAGDHA